MLPKKGKKLHGSGRGGGSELDFCSLIAVALRTELGSNHQAAKTIMRWTGARVVSAHSTRCTARFCLALAQSPRRLRHTRISNQALFDAARAQLHLRTSTNLPAIAAAAAIAGDTRCVRPL